ncbi:MAG: hypothetical protein OK456_01810 [Thaumarchaeota archaeon]|nr:hypothetical protein [Nitrososphaerota archaeon]
MIAEGAFFGFVFIGLYGWMISNADVAIGADYNRDILFWKKGGRNAVLAMIVVGFVLFNLPPWWFTGPNANLVENIGTVFGYVLTVVPIGYVIIVLPVSYRRIMDKRIKSYTLWVALSIATVFVAIFLPGPLAFVLFVAFLYFMYRAVGSLAIRTRTLKLP